MKLTTILSVALIAAAALPANAENAKAPKYIFYYIGDGMGMGPVMAAQTYNRQILENPEPLTMMKMPVVGWCQTWSYNSPVTDSAAAGTALATGYKTRNGMLGMDPDTVAVNSVAHDLSRLGYGVGLVTTVAPDDATPGAFYAHVPNRSMSYQVGIDFADSGFAFLSGAGLRGISDKEGNPTDLLPTLAQKGVQVVYGPDGIGEISSDRVILLNPADKPNWNVGYTIDSIPGVLNLPLMTQTCLDHLTRTSPDSFFMMVEGGNIDHALHANDGGAAIKETLNFDQALRIAYDFYLQHPDETLIIVTADHDTGGMALGNRTLHYDARVGNFDYQRVSKEEFSNYCKQLLNLDTPYSWDDMKQYLAQNLGLFGPVPVSPEREADLKNRFDETFALRNSDDQKTLYASFNAFAVEVFRALNDASGIGFTTTYHTGNPVPLFAVGIGAENFGGFNNNIDIPVVIRRLAGIQ